MNRSVLICFATFLAIGLTGSAFSQATAEGNNAVQHRGQTQDHGAIRDAHRYAMGEQRRMIQEIEDPEERQRRMDELNQAMSAMREAMMNANQAHCTATGEECQHHGKEARHGHAGSGGGEIEGSTMGQD